MRMLTSQLSVFSQCNLGREPFPLPPAPAPASLVPESYYEDPQPYDPISINGTSLFGPKGPLHANYLLLVIFSLMFMSNHYLT